MSSTKSFCGTWHLLHTFHHMYEEALETLCVVILLVLWNKPPFSLFLCQHLIRLGRDGPCLVLLPFLLSFLLLESLVCFLHLLGEAQNYFFL